MTTTNRSSSVQILRNLTVAELFVTQKVDLGSGAHLTRFTFNQILARISNLERLQAESEKKIVALTNRVNQLESENNDLTARVVQLESTEDFFLEGIEIPPSREELLESSYEVLLHSDTIPTERIEQVEEEADEAHADGQ